MSEYDPKKAFQDTDLDELVVASTSLGDGLRYMVPNNEAKWNLWEAWKDFRLGSYYDGTTPPEFVVIEDYTNEK